MEAKEKGYFGNFINPSASKVGSKSFVVEGSIPTFYSGAGSPCSQKINRPKSDLNGSETSEGEINQAAHKLKEFISNMRNRTPHRVSQKNLGLPDEDKSQRSRSTSKLGSTFKKTTDHSQIKALLKNLKNQVMENKSKSIERITTSPTRQDSSLFNFTKSPSKWPNSGSPELDKQSSRRQTEESNGKNRAFIQALKSSRPLKDWKEVQPKTKILQNSPTPQTPTQTPASTRMNTDDYSKQWKDLGPSLLEENTKLRREVQELRLNLKEARFERMFWKEKVIELQERVDKRLKTEAKQKLDYTISAQKNCNDISFS